MKVLENFEKQYILLMSENFLGELATSDRTLDENKRDELKQLLNEILEALS
jgi:hypothetical protein